MDVWNNLLRCFPIAFSHEIRRPESANCAPESNGGHNREERRPIRKVTSPQTERTRLHAS